MSQFIKGIFTDKDGTPSSKRIIMFMLVCTFIGVVIVNLMMGKQLSSVLADQLFYLVIYALAAVFGENVTTLFKKKIDAVSSSTEPGGDRPKDPPINP